ncbi:MAG: class I SAM-dependent methyltransferase [Thiohalocapsa sp.]
MKPTCALETRWTQRLRQREQPSEAELRDHLLAVHRDRPGFTEACAGRCRDSNGRNSYQWLAEIVDPSRHRRVLDLACGSGLLTALCHEQCGDRIELVAVDMSPDELGLAQQRVSDASVQFHHAMAQDMPFLADASIDVVLCHWALTLMDPVLPVLGEVRRVLRAGGVFSAIIDGELSAAPGYEAVHHLIYGWVQRECPGYGLSDMGDARVRTTASVATLVRDSFDGARVEIEPAVVSLHAAPDVLAREAAGFFYASFALSPAAHAEMLAELVSFFAARASDGDGGFSMPINRLSVRKQSTNR